MKKQNYLPSLLVIVTISAVVLFGCKKNLLSEEENSYTPINFKAVDIGNLHNQYVISAFDKIKSRLSVQTFQDGQNSQQRNNTNQEYYNIIFQEFSNIPYDPTTIGYTHAQFMNRVAEMTDSLSMHQYDVRNWNYAYVTQNAANYVGQIISEIEAATSLSDIYQRLNQIEYNATNNLTNIDFDIVKGTLEIARSSSYLWAPESEGGYDLLAKTFGINTSVLNNNSPIITNGLSWWKRALIGDVSASSQYFLGIGIGGSISAAFIPGSTAVLLGGWAIAAGVGSAYGAIGL